MGEGVTSMYLGVWDAEINLVVKHLLIISQCWLGQRRLALAHGSRPVSL